MQEGKPSRTALAAAGHRAAHQVLERGWVFKDPLAVRILGGHAKIFIRETKQFPWQRLIRIFIAVRTRFAEDSLAAAVGRGVRQLVVLGAGLDTFAYRSPFGDALRIFEVDYPATQEWKRERLSAAEIAVPGWLTFAPVDFEKQTLGEGLAAAGFDPSVRTFFTWLGVVPYLTEEAVWTTLRFIAGVSGGAQVVFDYSDPPETLSAKGRRYHDVRAARVLSAGEAWKTYLGAEKLRERLMEIGFREVEDLGPPEIAARFFPARRPAVPERGGHILLAGTG